MMGLERTYLHHFVRIFRVLLPVLVLMLVAVLVWNYSSRAQRSADSDISDSRKLEENLVNATEGLRYYQGGGDCFRIESANYLGFEGGTNELEDVEVVLGTCEGSEERRLRASRCWVGQSEELTIRCEGSVEVDLDPRTRIRTEALEYDSTTRALSSLASVEVVRDGEFAIRAARMNVRPDDRLLHFDGDVRLVREDGAVIEAGEVTYDENRRFVSAARRVRLETVTMELTSIRGEVWLEGESREPLRIEMRDNVQARSLVPGEPGVLSASELDADVEDGVVRTVRARRDVVVDANARSVRGDTVAAELDSEGRMMSLEARGGAQMRLDTGESIRSDWIRQSGDDLILTGQDSVLEAGGTVIRGSDFRIERGAVVRFTTSVPASITSASGVFQGQSTEAEFDTQAESLIRLEQIGDVRIDLGDQTGRAETVVVDPTWVALSGGARVDGADFALEGEALRVGREDDALEGDGEVFLIVQNTSGPVFVEADRLRGSRADTLGFEGSAVLRRAGGQVRAQRIDVQPDQGAFSAYGGVVSTMDDMMVRSESLYFDDAVGRVEYSGQVRASSPEMELESEYLHLSLVDAMIDRVDAAGDVRVASSDGLRGAGASATWLRSVDTLTLEGPGAEAVDAVRGSCRGDQIVIQLPTHDVSVRNRYGGRPECTPAPDAPLRD
jgi:lipopolysaccharide export system protein LptA